MRASAIVDAIYDVRRSVGKKARRIADCGGRAVERGAPQRRRKQTVRAQKQLLREKPALTRDNRHGDLPRLEQHGARPFQRRIDSVVKTTLLFQFGVGADARGGVGGFGSVRRRFGRGARRPSRRRRLLDAALYSRFARRLGLRRLLGRFGSFFWRLLGFGRGGRKLLQPRIDRRKARRQFFDRFFQFVRQGLDTRAQTAQRVVGKLRLLQRLLHLVERGARAIEPRVELFNRLWHLVAAQSGRGERRNQDGDKKGQSAHMRSLSGASRSNRFRASGRKVNLAAFRGRRDRIACRRCGQG